MRQLLQREGDFAIIPVWRKFQNQIQNQIFGIGQ